MQDGYLKAFAAMGSFAGKSSLTTWLTRIVINEAWTGIAWRNGGCACCIGNPWPSSTIIGRPSWQVRHGAFTGG